VDAGPITAHLVFAVAAALQRRDSPGADGPGCVRARIGLDRRVDRIDPQDERYRFHQGLSEFL
jgi:hypothetical protein